MPTPVNTTRGVKLILKVGNGASPEVFAALCTINAARGLTFTAATNDEEIPLCDTPESVAWVYREKQSLSMAFTGAGKNNKADTKKLWDWWKSEDPKNCQVIMDDDDEDNVITFEGLFHLSDFDITGDRLGKAESNITLASDGEVTADFGSNVGGT